MQNKKVVHSAVAGILAIGAAATSSPVFAEPDQPKNWEKCTGIAKAGMNDCQALDEKHACAGQSKTENDANEWVYEQKALALKLRVVK